MVTRPSEDDLFHSCWRLQTCDLCVSSRHICAWCAVSQTCVPNLNHGTLLPILAPIRNENVCPLGWQERWELRTPSFGCRCSTMTFMSVVIAVLSTIVATLLLWGVVMLGRWGVGKWKRSGKDWWKVDRVGITPSHLLCWPKDRAQPRRQPEIENPEGRALLS
jgi:hypothetical protein